MRELRYAENSQSVSQQTGSSGPLRRKTGRVCRTRNFAASQSKNRLPHRGEFGGAFPHQGQRSAQVHHSPAHRFAALSRVFDWVRNSTRSMISGACVHDCAPTRGATQPQSRLALLAILRNLRSRTGSLIIASACPGLHQPFSIATARSMSAAITRTMR